MTRRLMRLFWELFKISLFVIGGGYAIIAVADDVFARRGWTKEGELVDKLPVFQMVPGLVATHTAVYVGNKVAGACGALVGVVAVALPSVAVFTAVSMSYSTLPLGNSWLVAAFVGLRSALTGIIAATLLRSLRHLASPFAVAVFVPALCALAATELPVWIVLLAAMAAGITAQFASSGAGGGAHFMSPAWLGVLLFAKYGVLCFGGGFVLVPMYLQDFVGAAAPYLQLPAEEFSNLMALTQMTPGPIGVNGATYFGYRLAGVAGALGASAALLLPGSLLAFLAFNSLERFKASRVVQGLLKGVRPASVALMSVALWSFAEMSVIDAEGNFSFVAAALVCLSAVAARRKLLNPVLLIVLCAAVASVACR
ncbi:MAG: chromate transporter [Kiritimatiellae bacterium]|nr:chromate transporter [Kiritimatiellia bacterium]